MTVGELRAHLEGVPDTSHVRLIVHGDERSAVARATRSNQPSVDVVNIIADVR